MEKDLAVTSRVDRGFQRGSPHMDCNYPKFKTFPDLKGVRQVQNLAFPFAPKPAERI